MNREYEFHKKGKRRDISKGSIARAACLSGKFLLFDTGTNYRR